MKIRYMLVSYFLFLLKFISSSSATINWKLETIPAVFGDDIILKCTLPRICCKTMQSRRWLGGNDLHLLTMNGFSINTSKYSENLNKENKTSILIIHNFDIMDINIPYECIYGSSTFVNILNLTEDIFEYHKFEPYVGSINITNTNVLSVRISLERLYPRPKCSAAINDEDISSYMTATAILKGLFYCAIITVTFLLTPASCPGFLSITCEIGTYLYVYEKNITCNKIISDENQEPQNYHKRITTQENQFTDRFSTEQYALTEISFKMIE
ncbi:uncharacterized protein LOC143058780 isoform X2 [Mytilus galloprovincialis]|uniref:uncharacterized protein LOC143058780 isoform X2 n=1 Tax=Mytilus galloprovincialis TaxID=29158 RepID=UPI003F7C7C49